MSAIHRHRTNLHILLLPAEKELPPEIFSCIFFLRSLTRAAGSDESAGGGNDKSEEGEEKGAGHIDIYLIGLFEYFAPLQRAC